MVTITCPVNSTYGVCDLLAESGAGIGVFLEYLVVALPVLLIILAVVSIVVAVGVGVAKLITGGLSRGGRHR